MWNPFRRREPLEERQITAPWIMDLPDWWTAGNAAGENVNATSVLGLSPAWSAVGLLSDSISTLPVDAILVEGDRRVPSPIRPRWLDEPGQGLSRIDMLGQVMASLLVSKYGEAHILTPRTQGTVEGLVVLDPDRVQVDDNGNVSAVGEPLGPADVITIRGLMLPGTRQGIGPVGYAREVFGGALATQKATSAFWGNGSWTGAVIEVPGELSENGQKALKSYIEERHRGAGRAHKIGVLINGAKLSRPLVFSPEDSQFLGTRDFQVADVARMFRVPPEMIGGKSTDSLTYATLEGRGTHFVTYSLLHWLIRLEWAFTTLWRSEGGPDNGEVKFNVRGLLRGSTKERYDSYEVGLRAGFLTVDEVRAYEDLPPLGEQNQGDGGNG